MNVAFIPVRGGSKSIPLKNIKLIADKPLVYWTVTAACKCKDIDKVYVATDSCKIKNVLEEYKKDIQNNGKLEIIGRSPESATDTASTESAMLEFAEKHLFDNIVLIQATSPLLLHSDIECGFTKYNEDSIDSVLSVVKQKRFHWEISEDGTANPTNYDVFSRPRRQEFDGYYVENGAFYITSRKALLESKNRVSGNIGIVEMGEDSFFEIDEPSDWIIIEALMKKREANKICTSPEIKMFLTDCDGCLTDAGMYYSENGDELKKFNTRDGMAFKLMKEKGIITGIITGENRELVKRRKEKLGLDILEMGCSNKLSALKKMCEQYNVDMENIVYIGDDVNDIEVLKKVGYSCCPSDAMESVKSVSKYVSSVNGGEGVIRDIYEKIIK